MPKNGDFTSDDPLPVFLSERADETEQPGVGKAWDRASISSRILKASILVIAATAIAIIWVVDPAALFANVTASLVDISAFQPGTDRSMPTIQSTANAQVSPPPPDFGLVPPSDDNTAATDAPTRNEIAAAFKAADQSRTEINQPPSEALLKQFQAWGAEGDVRTRHAPVQPVQDARPHVRPMQKHRYDRSLQNAQAEIRPEQHHRAKVRREQNVRIQVQPVQNAPAKDQSVQNAEAPSVLQNFGWRN